VQALADAAYIAYARLQGQCVAIHLELRRADQAADVGDAHRKVRRAVHPTGLDRIVVIAELRADLGLPGVHRHPEQADPALVRHHAAIDHQLGRHLQPMTLLDLGFHLLRPGGVDDFHLAGFRPRHDPDRAGEGLRAGTALRHAQIGFVAIRLAFADHAADHHQRNQQQQDQSAHDGEPQQHLKGFHHPSSVGKGASIPGAGGRTMCRV